MSLRRRNVRQVSAVAEEDEVSSSLASSEPFVPSRSPSSPAQNADCSLSVALRRFSEYLVFKIETREHTGNEGDEKQENVIGKTVGKSFRPGSSKMQIRKILKSNKRRKVTPKSSPVIPSRPARYGISGSPPNVTNNRPSSSKCDPLSSLVVAEAMTTQESPDLGGSGSAGSEGEKKKPRRQSTVNRNSRPGRTSSQQDGLKSMNRPSIARSATQQALRRRSTMVKSTAQATTDRQQRLQRKPSLANMKSSAPASESKSGTAPKTAPKASTGGAKMGPVRILCHIIS